MDEAAQTPSRWLDWQKQRHRSRWDFAEYQYHSALGRLPELTKKTGLSNPKILDIGCGLGGMSAAYASDGGQVTAVDEELYDSKSIFFAEKFARSKGVDVTYLAVSENEWPFPDNTFDIIFLDSVIEHAKSPGRLLERATGALAPGGFMYVSFPVFFGPFGGHIYDYIQLPWYHLLPRSVVRATLRSCKPKGAYITPELVEGMYMSLNRMSYRRFRNLLETLPLETVSLSRSAFLTTTGNQLVHDVRKALAKRNWSGAWRSIRRAPQDFDLWNFCLFLFLFSTLPLMRIPYVQELFLGGIRATFQEK